MSQYSAYWLIFLMESDVLSANYYSTLLVYLHNFDKQLLYAYLYGANVSKEIKDVFGMFDMGCEL